jgi:uncharacterized membrane protein
MSQHRFPVRRFSRSETARAETFSDGIFAIAVTILVLGLTAPAHRPGRLAHALESQWPAYVGYFASFSYVAVIWLNHHQAFVRIRSMDRGLHAANFFVLFTTAALAFPTGVVADALQSDVSGADARVAVVLYASLASVMCLSWLVLYHHLGRHPELMDPEVEPTYVPHGRLRSWAGALAYAVAGVLGCLISPLIALGVFIVLPAFYFVSSEGLPAGRGPAGDTGA